MRAQPRQERSGGVIVSSKRQACVRAESERVRAREDLLVEPDDVV
jgi:hypothetical protein